jgi:hypothetical protein
MNKLYLSILLLISSTTGELISVCPNKPVFISLGGWCIPALFLRKFGLREAAYPFDWNLNGPISNVCRILENDFSGFFLKENLYVDPSHPCEIVDKGTNIASNHDFPTTDLVSRYVVPNFLDFHQQVYEKYQRRIKRFNNVCNSDKKVIFVRIDAAENLSKENTIMLRDCLHKKYPTLDFILIQLGCTEMCKTPWNIERVRNFYIDGNSIQGNPTLWHFDCWNQLLKGIEEICDCPLVELQSQAPNKPEDRDIQ